MFAGMEIHKQGKADCHSIKHFHCQRFRQRTFIQLALPSNSLKGQ
jgi:hypothetical protein